MTIKADALTIINALPVRKLSRGRPHDSQALKNLGVIGSCSHEGSSLDPCAAA